MRFWIAFLWFLVSFCPVGPCLATEFSDFFSGSGLDAKWTAMDPYGGTGSASVGDGYLSLSMAKTGDMPFVLQNDSLGSSFDIRVAVYLPSLPSGAMFQIRVMPQWSDMSQSISVVYNSALDGSLLRSDYVGGHSYDGSPADLSGQQNFYVRLLAVSGVVVCSYKVNPSDEWTVLAANTTNLTLTTIPIDFGFLGYSASGSQVIDVDWVVEDGEYSGYPSTEPSPPAPETSNVPETVLGFVQLIWP